MSPGVSLCDSVSEMKNTAHSVIKAVAAAAVAGAMLVSAQAPRPLATYTPTKEATTYQAS